MKKITKKSVVLLLLLVMLAGMLAGCKTKEEKGFRTMEDFANARIGVITGSAHELTLKRVLPQAERVYFNSMADAILAVEQGKIDGYIEDEQFLSAVLWEGATVKRLDGTVKQVTNGFIFPQSDESRVLREQVNAFIAASALPV